MARHLGALPGRKPCIEVAKLPLGLGLQPFDLGGNVDAAVVCGIAKVRNSRLQLRNGLFELKKRGHWRLARSEEHTSELQSLMRISYAVFCLKKKTPNIIYNQIR